MTLDWVPTGPELEVARKGLRLSREKFCAQLGEPWTASKLISYEREQRVLKPAERQALAQWVLRSRVPEPEPEPEPTPEPAEIVLLTSEEWPEAEPAPTFEEVTDRFMAVQQEVAKYRVQVPFEWPLAQPLAPTRTAAELVLIDEWCANVESWLALLREDGQVLAPIPVTETVTQPSPTAPSAPVEVAVAEVAAPATGTVGAAALHDIGGIRALTNSELQTFKHCRRRWWLSWYRGLRLKREVAVGNAPLGTRVHRALAGWYVPEGQIPVDPRETFEAIVREDELALIASYADEPDGAEVVSKITQFGKEAEIGRAMIEGYVEWLAETGADSEYRVIAPEQVLTVVLEMSDELTVRLQGKLDVRVQRDHDLVKLFIDHKTVTDFQTITQIAQLDEQMKQYHLLEEANDGPENRTEGVIYNMLRKVKRTAAAHPPFYERFEVRHNPLTIRNFHDRVRGEALVIDHTERLLDAGANHQLVVYPSPGRDCTWRCEFAALCPMFDDGSRAEDFIDSYYEAVNPLDRYLDEAKGTQ